MQPDFDSQDDSGVNKYSDSPEFDALKDRIIEQLFEINGQINTINQFSSTLEKFLNNEGDNSLNVKVIDNIDKKAIQNIEKIKGLISVINEEVCKVEKIEVAELNQLQIIAKDKIIRDIRSSIKEFQNLQKRYTALIKRINEKARLQLENKHALLVEEENEATQHVGQAPVQIQNKNIVIPRESINNEEFAYQQNLIRQRDEEIINIERGITEINDIFTDLSNVIQDQGMIVDNIEANIYSTLDNTQLASNELNKAMRYQRKSSKWCLYLLMILTIMLFFMMLVILI
ncbi:hypothetical protein TPHA_0C00330 [Tetrapisispora phaffii CBS 4417]|uniref:t-SNARE coiled-coil homology domain-containing protein n=1 Tax=Tetrapisispora phaffii (strain ATCC 24235 / CBS 4417 / NBRC 1672 / NRRL Y-8282 / UCD 70-5) TaxID=1071381 RepID=G8BR14_TETPH|nr:hypothetical protein TPHA_0C00330 [Tetrapisispora phaffii CBS 4417]CCE62190.1 hypothetical protein TPHA_0C00330 [Tetrapisispora phaffii CBS 4417]